MALLIVQLNTRQETGWESLGVTSSKGPQAGNQTLGHHSENKASAHVLVLCTNQAKQCPILSLLNTTVQGVSLYHGRYLLHSQFEVIWSKLFDLFCLLNCFVWICLSSLPGAEGKMKQAFPPSSHERENSLLVSNSAHTSSCTVAQECTSLWCYCTEMCDAVWRLTTLNSLVLLWR